MARRYFFGEWRESNAPLTPADVAELCHLAEKRREEMARYPMDRVWALLASLKEKWSDPNYAPRRMLETELPAETHFSTEMVRMGMLELVGTLDPEVLEKKVFTELRQ